MLHEARILSHIVYGGAACERHHVRRPDHVEVTCREERDEDIGAEPRRHRGVALERREDALQTLEVLVGPDGPVGAYAVHADRFVLAVTNEMLANPEADGVGEPEIWGVNHVTRHEMAVIFDEFDERELEGNELPQLAPGHVWVLLPVHVHAAFPRGVGRFRTCLKILDMGNRRGRRGYCG